MPANEVLYSKINFWVMSKNVKVKISQKFKYAEE